MQTINLQLTNNRATFIYYCGLLGLLLAFTDWSWMWFLASVAVHTFVVSLYSAVVHRYYCHRGYEANPTVMWLLSFIPVGYGYATPVTYSYVHNGHHALADKEDDPHGWGWYGLLHAKYKLPPKKFLLAGKWFYSKRQDFLHNNAFAVFFLLALGTAMISWQALIWLHLVPICLLHLGNALHKTFSHGYKRNGAKNYWFLEYVFPMGGEWIHNEHHDQPRKSRFRNKWYEFDPGWLIVKVLTKSTTTSN